jgi:hypothetical protein
MLKVTFYLWVCRAVPAAAGFRLERDCVMRTLRIGAAAAAIAASFVALAGPARAGVFADFTPDAASADYRWVQSASNTGGHFFTIDTASDTSAQAVASHFSFLDPALSMLVFLPTKFELDAFVADGTPAQSIFGVLFSQPGLTGSFQFIYNGPNTVIAGHPLVNGVTNVLSGVFSNGRITGAGHSGSANLALSNGGSLTYTSDLGSFGGADEFSFNLLGVTPGFSAGSGKSLNNFIANGGGNFSDTPEPETWGLMILGFGGLGLMARARRRRQLV